MYKYLYKYLPVLAYAVSIAAFYLILKIFYVNTSLGLITVSAYFNFVFLALGCTIAFGLIQRYVPSEGSPFLVGLGMYSKVFYKALVPKMFSLLGWTILCVSYFWSVKIVASLLGVATPYEIVYVLMAWSVCTYYKHKEVVDFKEQVDAYPFDKLFMYPKSAIDVALVGAILSSGLIYYFKDIMSL